MASYPSIAALNVSNFLAKDLFVNEQAFWGLDRHISFALIYKCAQPT